MDDREFHKLAFDLLAAANPSPIANDLLWYTKKAEWLTEFTARRKAENEQRDVE